MTNEPTQEQIKKLWEWCGLYKKKHPKGNWFMWHSPDGNYLGNSPPELDLNNLFKYAVPKLIKLDGTAQGGIEFRFYPGGTSCILTLQDEAGFNEEDYFLKDSHNPALALFWAIWEMIRPNGCKECGIEEPLEREIIAHRSTSTDRNYHNDR